MLPTTRSVGVLTPFAKFSRRKTCTIPFTKLALRVGNPFDVTCVLSFLDPNPKKSMFEMLPYIWFLFMAGLIVATIVGVIMSQPKKVRKAAEPEPAPGESMEEAAEPELDFGDELARMEQK